LSTNAADIPRTPMHVKKEVAALQAPSSLRRERPFLQRAETTPV
jgi:hypothetical protein